MVFDVSGLPLAGEGHHGKVYRLGKKFCVKVYKKKSFLEMEYNVLKHSERYPYFPKVYKCADNYMIRDFFEGPTLWEYLREHGLSESLAVKILELLDCFHDLGYSKLDCHLHHVIVTKGEEFKVIDPTTMMERKASYPRALLEKLDDLGLKSAFLEFTRKSRPGYYEKWKNL